MPCRSSFHLDDAGRGLEEARHLNVVVFDKTGTLTLGAHRVVEAVPAEGQSDDEVLALAAAVERDSEHPIAYRHISAICEAVLSS